MKLTKEQLKQIIKEELELFENEDPEKEAVKNYLQPGDAFTYRGFETTPPRGLDHILPDQMKQILAQLESEGKIVPAERGYFSVVQEGHFSFGPFLGKSLSVDYPEKETLELLTPIFANIENSYGSLGNPESQKEFEDALTNQLVTWKETWQRRRDEEPA